MRLDLIRHPRPEITPGVCYGRSDIPVAPVVMREVLTQLLEHVSVPARIVSSPLQRCLNLAQALSDQLGLAPPRVDARLREMDFGAWEGRSWEQIGQAEVSAWEQDMAHYRPGGGESVVQMLRRVAACYEDLRAADEDVIVMCHAGTIRLMRAWHAAGGDTQELEAIARQVVQARHEIAYGQCITLEI